MRGVSNDYEFSRRMMLGAGLGGLVWAGLVARLFQLQVLEREKYSQLAEQNHVKFEPAPPLRGTIYDRFGNPLASHRRAGRVSILPEQVDNLPALLARLSSLIDIPDEKIVKLATEIENKRRSRAGFQPVIVAQELTFEDFSRLNVYAPEMNGLKVEMAQTRSYPRGRDFAHVLGYVARASGDDIKRMTEAMDGDEAAEFAKMFRHPDMRTGRQGMERYAEEWLRGKLGYHTFVTNAHGRAIEQIPDERVAPKPGKDLYLTVDADLQKVAIERFEGESGAAVVVDIASGDVLAIVSTPAFDPNDFVNGISSKDYAALRDNDRSPLYPRAHGGVYPPGSTFKMITAVAALEAGVMTPEDRVRCTGYYYFGNRAWACWKRGGHGTVDLHNAIKQSCDCYFYEAARRAGVDKIAEVARRFGFDREWVLGMTGARAGLIPDKAWKERARGEKWMDGETLNVGIGQGQVGTTPVQLAVMTARIAAEGAKFKPRLIGLGPEVKEDSEVSGAIDRELMKLMKAGMFGVTSEPNGTALRSGDLGLGGPRLAGKTGTAQVRRITAAERARGIRKGSEIERELRDHALFVAYAPADNPKYAISVIVEHGEGGSRTAAPVARDILAHALKTDSGREPIYTRSASLKRQDEGGEGPA
jgi:penicillin-binding protein 2